MLSIVESVKESINARIAGYTVKYNVNKKLGSVQASRKDNGTWFGDLFWARTVQTF